MKRIIGALKAKLSRPKAPVADDQSSNTVSVEGVLMPDIYADEHVATVSDLKTPDPSAPDTDKSTGFNPDDTAVLQKK